MLASYCQKKRDSLYIVEIRALNWFSLPLFACLIGKGAWEVLFTGVSGIVSFFFVGQDLQSIHGIGKWDWGRGHGREWAFFLKKKIGIGTWGKIHA